MRLCKHVVELSLGKLRSDLTDAAYRRRVDYLSACESIDLGSARQIGQGLTVRVVEQQGRFIVQQKQRLAPVGRDPDQQDGGKTDRRHDAGGCPLHGDGVFQ